MQPIHAVKNQIFDAHALMDKASLGQNTLIHECCGITLQEELKFCNLQDCNVS